MTRDASPTEGPDRRVPLVPPTMTSESAGSPEQPLEVPAAPAGPVFSGEAEPSRASEEAPRPSGAPADVMELTEVAEEEGPARMEAAAPPPEAADPVDLADRLERIAVRLRRGGAAALEAPGDGDALDRMLAELLSAYLVPGGGTSGER